MVVVRWVGEAHERKRARQAAKMAARTAHPDTFWTQPVAKVWHELRVSGVPSTPLTPARNFLVSVCGADGALN